MIAILIGLPFVLLIGGAVAAVVVCGTHYPVPTAVALLLLGSYGIGSSIRSIFKNAANDQTKSA